MEGDKDLVGESTKGGFFLVVGERMRKYLASVGLLLITCSSKENSAIWSKFGLKLQKLYLMILCKDFFKFKHLSMMGHNRLAKVTMVNFRKKKCLWPICPKIMQACIL